VLARQQKELEEVKEEAAAMIRRAEEKLQRGTYFQQLIALKAVEPAPSQPIAIDGKVTKALIETAKKAKIVNLNEIIPGFSIEMMNAIRKGREERQIDGVNEIADLASRLNPFGSRFYTETLPGVGKLLAAMATGQIKKEDIINSMADSLVKEYIEPINQMFAFAVDVANKKATYGESKQFGYNLGGWNEPRDKTFCLLLGKIT